MTKPFKIGQRKAKKSAKKKTNLQNREKKYKLGKFLKQPLVEKKIKTRQIN